MADNNNKKGSKLKHAAKVVGAGVTVVKIILNIVLLVAGIALLAFFGWLIVNIWQWLSAAL